MSSKVPMTAAGLRKLKDELKLLKTIERPRISKEIEVARGHGDLRENAEYHAAKEKQAHIEARIRLVDEWIAHAEVIDVTKLRGEQVVFGARWCCSTWRWKRKCVTGSSERSRRISRSDTSRSPLRWRAR